MSYIMYKEGNCPGWGSVRGICPGGKCSRRKCPDTHRYHSVMTFLIEHYNRCVFDQAHVTCKQGRIRAPNTTNLALRPTAGCCHLANLMARSDSHSPSALKCSLRFSCNVLSFRSCKTSSSAVVERPRDALCPSAVSLNKIITREDSFIIVTQASDLSLGNVVFGVTLRLFIARQHTDARY